MSKVEYVDLSGLRQDGRRPHELRKLSAKLGISSRATGSVMLDHGHTKILACVLGPRECASRAKEAHDRTIIDCEVFMAPFAQANRRKRHRGDRNTSELAAIIRQTFEAVLFTSVYPRSQIDITVEILHADGPVRAW
jgi:exosome complex component RRP41